MIGGGGGGVAERPLCCGLRRDNFEVFFF